MKDLYRVCEHLLTAGKHIVCPPMHHGDSHLIICVECSASEDGVNVFEVRKEFWEALRADINSAPDVQIN